MEGSHALPGSSKAKRKKAPENATPEVPTQEAAETVSEPEPPSPEEAEMAKAVLRRMHRLRHDAPNAQQLIEELGDPDPDDPASVAEIVGHMRLSQAIDPVGGIPQGELLLTTATSLNVHRRACNTAHLKDLDDMDAGSSHHQVLGKTLPLPGPSKLLLRKLKEGRQVTAVAALLIAQLYDVSTMQPYAAKRSLFQKNSNFLLDMHGVCSQGYSGPKSTHHSGRKQLQPGPTFSLDCPVENQVRKKNFNKGPL